MRQGKHHLGMNRLLIPLVVGLVYTDVLSEVCILFKVDILGGGSDRPSSYLRAILHF